MKNNAFRIGIGYDIHKFIRGRKLVLGGVRIKHGFGLDGHSDADVLVHSVMDSMLGAAGLRDIGYYFPNSEKKYKNISSLKLLKLAGGLVHNKGYLIVNIDSTLISEAPKISPYVNAMKKKIAGVLKIKTDCVGIKATTNEGAGYIGAGEAAASYSVCLLVRR